MVAMMPSSAVTSVGSTFLNPWPSQSQTAVIYPSALCDEEEVTVSRHHTCVVSGGRAKQSQMKWRGVERAAETETHAPLSASSPRS